MPGPSSLAARSEPFVLGTWTADDLTAYLAAHGAGCVVLDVANATSSSDVIDALKAEIIAGKIKVPDFYKGERVK